MPCMSPAMFRVRFHRRFPMLCIHVHVHVYNIGLGMLYIHLVVCSETSDEGHFLLRTHRKPCILMRGLFASKYNFRIRLVYFQPLRRGHLPIKDVKCWCQGVPYIEVALYRCGCVFHVTKRELTCVSI